MKKENKGFSLVELIIVIAVLALLVGVLAPQYMKYVRRTEEAKMLKNFDELVKAMILFQTDLEAGAILGGIGGDGVININSPVADDIDRAATDFCEEVFGAGIDEYRAVVTFDRNRGEIVNQIWVYYPAGKDVRYIYNTDYPGMMEGPLPR